VQAEEMKIRFLSWDRAPQVIFGIGALLGFLPVVAGSELTLWGAVVAGFNLGAFFQATMALAYKRRADEWRKRAEVVFKMLVETRSSVFLEQSFAKRGIRPEEN
jgi:hypothetical protein